MNLKERRNKCTDFFNECLGVADTKGHDYSKEEDAFSNFKKIADMLDVPISKVLLFFIACKVARLVELQDKEPNHESIKDTYIDLANYISFGAILEDNE